MDVKLPKLGEGAESGTVVSVLVKEGERVDRGQTILELENEKAVAPIPSTTSGVVQSIRVKVGDQLTVGQSIMTIEEVEQASQTPASRAVAKEVVERSGQSKTPITGKEEPIPLPPEVPRARPESVVNKDPVAPPSIRKISRELGINLALIKGSGPGGRIAMADLRDYIQRLQQIVIPGSANREPPPSGTSPDSTDFSRWGPITTQPLTPLRHTISRRLSESWSTIPHVTQFDEIDVTELNLLRKKYVQAYEDRGEKLTLTVFVLHAVAAALRKHPLLNASLDEARQTVIIKQYFHIGLAVDTDQGLLVPVVRDVDQKTLLELARDVARLAEKARTRKLTLDEMKGGTFTVSNQGGIGGGHFTPIINKPEVAILGLGRGALKPVLQNNQVVPRLMVPIALSYDHRLIDGGVAARFVVDLGEAFQSFSEKNVAPSDSSLLQV